jgi:hypothetical protein
VPATSGSLTSTTSDAAKEPQWGKITDVVTGQEMRAGLRAGRPQAAAVAQQT